jgi:hypothetical protein
MQTKDVFQLVRLIAFADAWSDVTGPIFERLNQGRYRAETVRIPRAIVREMAGTISAMPRPRESHAADLHGALIEQSVVFTALLTAIIDGDSGAVERERERGESLGFRIISLLDRMRTDTD